MPKYAIHIVQIGSFKAGSNALYERLRLLTAKARKAKLTPQELPSQPSAGLGFAVETPLPPERLSKIFEGIDVSISKIEEPGVAGMN